MSGSSYKAFSSGPKGITYSFLHTSLGKNRTKVVIQRDIKRQNKNLTFLTWLWHDFQDGEKLKDHRNPVLKDLT